MTAALADLQRPMNIADFFDTPDTGDQCEIVNGEMIVTPPPAPRHGEVVLALYDQLKGVVKRHRLGKLYVAPVGVRFSENDILQPDLFFISAERKTTVSQKFVDGAPDFVAEILSPSSRRMDLVQKMLTYQRAGVREYWVVDLDTRSIRVFALHDDKLIEQPIFDGPLTSSVIPGVAIDVGELFAGLW